MNPRHCIDCGSTDGGFHLYDSDGEFYGYLCLDCQNTGEETSGAYLSYSEEEE